MAPSAAEHRGKIEYRRRRKPAKFACLPAPKRDRPFGVAQLACQIGFRSFGSGFTITSHRAAGARWIGLSHQRNPGRVCNTHSKPGRLLNFLQRALGSLKAMLTDIPPPKSPSGQHIVEERLEGADTAFSNEQYQDAYPPGIERSFWHVARNLT